VVAVDNMNKNEKNLILRLRITLNYYKAQCSGLAKLTGNHYSNIVPGNYK
jgi:hypothetical protein